MAPLWSQGAHAEPMGTQTPSRVPWERLLGNGRFYCDGIFTQMLSSGISAYFSTPASKAARKSARDARVSCRRVCHALASKYGQARPVGLALAD